MGKLSPTLRVDDKNESRQPIGLRTGDQTGVEVCSGALAPPRPGGVRCSPSLRKAGEVFAAGILRVAALSHQIETFDTDVGDSCVLGTHGGLARMGVRNSQGSESTQHSVDPKKAAPEAADGKSMDVWSGSVNGGPFSASRERILPCRRCAPLLRQRISPCR